MIPLLPCRSIDDQLAFYEALGFEVTYWQTAPNAYAAVQRGAIELHFFVLKGYEPADSYSTCYVFTSDVDQLYADFRAGLKRALGRIPSRGIPRIGAIGDMSYGVRQFLLTDPGGNIIRIGQPLEKADAAETQPLPRLDRALEAARLLLYSKGDPETTARVIDDALAATPDASDVLRVQARILRADAAHALGDDALAAALLAEVRGVSLGADNQASLADDLARAEELRTAIG
jgi:catechol 2,3-dioxygenase-like lactoylglutathione lyase family enzyme